MILEGVVTNAAAFGAFVDVGVHQDGLVHISAMSDKFVADPRDVVKPGDIVRVKVLEVDLQRKRISLTLRLDDEPGRGDGRERPQRQGRGGQNGGGQGNDGGQGGGRGGARGQGNRGQGGGRPQGGQGGGRPQGGQGGQRGQGGQSGGQGGGRGGRGSGDRGQSGGSSGSSGAMADALRRAGLDKGLPRKDR